MTLEDFLKGWDVGGGDEGMLREGLSLSLGWMGVM